MINDDQLQICLYHPHPQQPHRYTRQILRITNQTTCREVLTHYIPEPNTARLVETCLGFEREIPLGDCLFDVITRNQAIEEFKIVVRRIHDNNNNNHNHHQRRRTTMRSPTLNNNNHPSSHDINNNQQPQQQTNGNGFAISSLSMDLSLSELQEMAARQQQQIEHNQQLLLAREQRLKYLKQQEVKQQQTSHDSLRLKRLKEHIEQQELKHLRLKTLQNQINQQRNSNSTLANELEILKQIFFDKEHELTIALNKVDELTKQLDQLRKIKITTNKEQSQNKNELDKLKQELMIRNKLNEQQSRKIAYQREVYASKQAELNQLDRRIEELQQRLKKKRIFTSNRTTISTPSVPPSTTTAVVEPFTSTTGYRTAFDTVQDTLNNVKIAEIEKRMVQLANSFNATSSSSPTNINEQINNSNSPKKPNGMLLSNQQSKIAFASKSEIAATYMARTSNQSISPSLLNNKKATDMMDSNINKTEQQLLPPNLRLNDDILSVHFNNVTSTIKKRHSLSDPADSLIKYLSSNVSSNNNNTIQSQAIQVRDDSSNQLLTDTKISPIPTVVAYENLIDIQTNLNNKNDDEQKMHHEEQQVMLESVVSDTESEGEHSDGIESAISSPTTITTTVTTLTMNLKSLLKTSTTPKNLTRRVMFDPLALLLDAAVVGELDLVMKAAKEVENPSQPNDEGLTALHNAVCASNFDCVKFLVEFGCDINFADNDGWTPLHCAASCNNTPMVQFLVEHGACIYATTIRDNETAAEKCEEEEENYATCSQYLLFVQNDLGVINNSLVYGLYDFEPSNNTSDDPNNNELSFKDGDQLRILRRGDENENEWWWAKHETTQQEGYVPRNYLGLYPRVRPGSMASTSC
ncbi:unnamed protein product [Rotaria sordida]|uniref:SH3 domain-containing protein n=1 Tax=Rotaria sordida TaxID=392033 RepID=A0A813WKW0_9BILA|nr:unnamed protein product [Rotaria sordida]